MHMFKVRAWLAVLLGLTLLATACGGEVTDDAGEDSGAEADGAEVDGAPASETYASDTPVSGTAAPDTGGDQD